MIYSYSNVYVGMGSTAVKYEFGGKGLNDYSQ